MGMTMSEKILAHGAGLDSVAAGEIVSGQGRRSYAGRYPRPQDRNC